MNLELRHITSDNFYAVCQLEVTSKQQQHIDSNAISLAEANFMEFAWFRAIYVNDVLVGFILVDANLVTNKFMLWRFMLDKSHQFKGYGRKAIETLVIELKKEFSITTLFTSVVSSDEGPLAFYTSCGFVATGHLVDEREIELCLPV